MSRVFDGDSLKMALVLPRSPACKPIGMRPAGQVFSPSPLAGEGLGRGGSVAAFGCGVVLCADARCFGVGVRPTAEILSFASPKESIQRKGDPGYAPSAFGCGFPALLESRGGCGTRFAQTVLADYPAPSCDARRDLRD